MTDPYSKQVRALFREPAHAGRLDDGIEARVDDQGVRIHLTLSASGGRVRSARFQAWGCPHVLAACEAFCRAAEGRDLSDLADYSAATLMQSLAIPVEKTSRILVLEDAVRSLGAAAAAPNDSQS
ncbi:MAG: iron-sulfur cluster assembly scaffold protein [Woeseiaceae bacterium]|nr:iron-sulfur cluster assembly scaffold protein [Woeseiaceae bacterium]